MPTTNSSGRSRCLPLLHRVRPEEAKRAAGDEMTLKAECVVDGGMNGKEAAIRRVATRTVKGCDLGILSEDEYFAKAVPVRASAAH
jgi:hypothetical protein